jgi:hypothetical protein
LESARNSLCYNFFLPIRAIIILLSAEVCSGFLILNLNNWRYYELENSGDEMPDENPWKEIPFVVNCRDCLVLEERGGQSSMRLAGGWLGLLYIFPKWPTCVDQTFM